MDAFNGILHRRKRCVLGGKEPRILGGNIMTKKKWERMRKYQKRAVKIIKSGKNGEVGMFGYFELHDFDYLIKRILVGRE